MRDNISVSAREVKFFIFTSMLFAIFEALSIEFNNFFNNVSIFGYQFSLNFSVIFFCLGFFIIDLVTEIYNDRYANYFIYAKLVSQLAFVSLGVVAVLAAGITDGQISQTFFVAPRILGNAMVASFIGYKLTGKIMQALKIRFRGRFLFTRYLSSTFPGEVIFSLVFTLLSFSHGKNVIQILNIFIGLVAVKFVFSSVVSLLIVPVTNLIRHYLKLENSDDLIKSVPFTSD